MSDRSTLSLIELPSIYAGIDEKDILSFSVPTVSKETHFFIVATKCGWTMTGILLQILGI